MYPTILPGSEAVGRHVRCYCNLPICVSTGYMCKSHGGCYSELTQDRRRARHGCLDEDPNVDLSSKCMNSPGKGIGPWGTSLLLCCNKDMCNHVDDPSARVRINDSLTGASSTNLIGFSNGGNFGLSPGSGNGASNNFGDTSAENWFRAATIFVPICGALILVVLIGVAIKLLRSDSTDASNKLSAAYIHHVPSQRPMEQSLMKKSPIIRATSERLPAVHAPLLLSHSNPTHTTNERFIIGSGKNDNINNLSNSSICRENFIIMQRCPQNQNQLQTTYSSSQPVKPTNTEANRDVNVNIELPNDDETSECLNVKLYEKQLLPSDDKLYNKETILNWNQNSANGNIVDR